MKEKDKIAIIREITGLDEQRAEVVYKAFVKQDWSKIATEELRTPGAPKDPISRAEAFLAKGETATFRRSFLASIIIERSRRKARQEMNEFLSSFDEEFREIDDLPKKEEDNKNKKFTPLPTPSGMHVPSGVCEYLKQCV
jgi:hypothetical protein